MKEKTRMKRREGLISTLPRAFVKGSNYTRFSFFVMGSGQMARKQWIKGILYLLTQAAFITYLVLFGGGYLRHLFSGRLGSRLSGEVWNEQLQIYEKIKGDNSFLILLYAVVTLVLLAVFTVIWAQNIKGSYENDLRIQRGFIRARQSEILSPAFNSAVYRAFGVYAHAPFIYGAYRVHQLRF